MKASFYMWVARNSSGWSSKTSLITIEDTNLSAAGSKNTNTSRDRRSSNKAFLTSQPTRILRKSNQRTKHPGSLNKGNTCSANSILQALSKIPSFSFQSASESGFLSPLNRAVTLNMSLWKDKLLLWILRPFCGCFIGNSHPISRYLSSLTPNRMYLRSFR